MQKQVDKVNETLDKHDNRITWLERIMWIMIGVSIDNLDSLPFLKSIVGQ